MFMHLDRRERARIIRQRVVQAMEEKGLNQSELARDIGVDRSTISQLLSSPLPRVPNAHVIAGCAAALGVSTDWLLGLGQEEKIGPNISQSPLLIACFRIAWRSVFDIARSAARISAP